MNKFEKYDDTESGKIKELMRDKLTSSGSDSRVDFLYKEKANPEEYLLGKRIDKQFEQHNFAQKTESAVGATFDDDAIKHNLIKESQIKQRDDPLFAIRKREEDKRRELLNNPVRMKQLERVLESKKKANRKSSGDELLAQYMAIKGAKTKIKEKKRKKEKRKLPDDEKSLLQRYLELIGKSKRYVFYIDSSSSEDEDEPTRGSPVKRQDPRKRELDYGHSPRRDRLTDDLRRRSRSPYQKSSMAHYRDTNQRSHPRTANSRSPIHRNRDNSRENRRHSQSPDRRQHRADSSNQRRSPSPGSNARHHRDNKRDERKVVSQRQYVDRRRSRSRSQSRGREDGRRDGNRSASREKQMTSDSRSKAYRTQEYKANGSHHRSERKRSRSNEQKRSRPNERKRSRSNERKRLRSNERKRSRSNERKRSRSNERKRSRSNERKRSRSNERKRSRSRERKRSIERKRSRERQRSRETKQSNERKQSRSNERKQSRSPVRRKSDKDMSKSKPSAQKRAASPSKDARRREKRKVSESSSESESSSGESNSGSESGSASSRESSSGDSRSSPERKLVSRPKPSFGLLHPKGKDVLDAKASMDAKRHERAKGEAPPSTEVQKEKPYKPESRKRLTAEEKAARLAEMSENADWRDEQRKINVERYKREEEEEQKRTDRQRRSSGEFMKPLMTKHAEESSVEEQIRRNRHKIQRNTIPGLETNFVSK